MWKLPTSSSHRSLNAGSGARAILNVNSNSREQSLLPKALQVFVSASGKANLENCGVIGRRLSLRQFDPQALIGLLPAEYFGRAQ